jgi:cupin superfamily acireductone dioxygenase involved in methionine salvage
MKPKLYRLQKVEAAAEALANAPLLPKQNIEQEVALKKLAKSIKELNKNKNYEPRQIVQLLKQNEMRVTLKEVKQICGAD